ncbi:MAG TPA: YbjQ family protein [Candidatus Paceibacterota bacterium]
MIITTTDTVPEKQIGEILGIARGGTVRARHIGNDIMAGLKTIVGGEIEEYTKLQAQAREQALQRMIKDAEAMNADAVVTVRFVTSMIAAGASEIVVYGTAVRFK